MEEYYSSYNSQAAGIMGITMLQRIKKHLGKYITVKAYDSTHSTYESSGFLSGVLDYPLVTLVLAGGTGTKYICLKDIVEITTINGRSGFVSFIK